MIAQKDKQTGKKKVLFVLFTVALSLVAFAFYRFSLYNIEALFPIVMWTYLVSLAFLAIFYIFYNRGFLHKGITEDMLPSDWDDEKKREFVRDAESRMRRSAWMICLMIAFLMTFVLEAIELFVLPIFYGWFR